MTRVARLQDLEEGRGKCVRVQGRAVALFRQGSLVHAIDDTCPHRGSPLSDGVIQGDFVECPLHAWCFDLRSGAMRGNPALRIPTYRVEIRGDEIYVGPAA